LSNVGMTQADPLFRVRFAGRMARTCATDVGIATPACWMQGHGRGASEGWVTHRTRTHLFELPSKIKINK